MSLRIASEPPPWPAQVQAGTAVVRSEGVAVRYRVPQEQIGTFKEYVIRRLRGGIVYQDLWALHGVTLDVYQGEILGIVGRNGAGKSTLLKVVSRILRPTRGRIRVKGSVAPLLELGAGFHPELTGRENIFLNGTLLGHSQREIEERFDEILAFAEIEEFIGAPLRTYSTGMVARLGFAVATAWEPDILIVDEILSVGDEAFRRKCAARMATFQSRGTTILLVSHSATMVEAMCHRAIWLDHGIVKALGPAAEVVRAYQGAYG